MKLYPQLSLSSTTGSWKLIILTDKIKGKVEDWESGDPYWICTYIAFGLWGVRYCLSRCRDVFLDVLAEHHVDYFISPPSESLSSEHRLRALIVRC